MHLFGCWHVVKANIKQFFSTLNLGKIIPSQRETFRILKL